MVIKTVIMRRKMTAMMTIMKNKKKKKMNWTVEVVAVAAMMVLIMMMILSTTTAMAKTTFFVAGFAPPPPSSSSSSFTVSRVKLLQVSPSKSTTGLSLSSPPPRWQRRQQRRRQSSSTSLFSSSFDSETSSVASSSSSSSTTAAAAATTTTSAAITVIDPATQCEVVLLGCFHGTQSSADDVERVVDCDTDVIVLELCTSRFVDLRKMQEKQQEQQQRVEEEEEQSLDTSNRSTSSSSLELLGKAVKSSWPVRYVDTVATTARKKGVATGVAAGLLLGVSGLQSAMSGFVPGLEFLTALDKGKAYNCDIVLADQDVDETLRKLGSLPIDVWKVLTVAGGISSSYNNKIKERPFVEECMFHLTTLKRAVLGGDMDSSAKVPQVQIVNVLLRDKAAIRDLVRLTVPALIAVVLSSRLLMSILRSVSASDWSSPFLDQPTVVEDMNMMTTAMSLSSSSSSSGGLLIEEGIVSWVVHMIASSFILLAGFFSMTPIIKIILTERDEILTEGILAACQRAGNGGRVVAVLGLLHVNGVAQRIVASGGGEEEDGRP